MAAGRGGPGTALFRTGTGRLSYTDRLERIKTLPEEKLTPGDKAVRLIEESLLTAVQCLIRQARDGSPTAAKALLEMGGLYQPGLKITGELQHQHEHRVLQVNVREVSRDEYEALQAAREVARAGAEAVVVTATCTALDIEDHG